MKQIICLSNEPWSASPGRTQQLLSRLKDTQILYFSPAARWNDPSFHAKGRQVKQNITVYTLPPLLLPMDERFGHFFRLGQQKLSRFIAAKAARARFSSPLLWTTCPEHVHLLDRLDYDGLVYDCDREWDDLPLAWEGALAGAADVVFAASSDLMDRLSPCSSNIALLPNGGTYPLFAKATAPDRVRPSSPFHGPVLGYAGTIHYDLDLSPLLYAARPGRLDVSALRPARAQPLPAPAFPSAQRGTAPLLSPDGGTGTSGTVSGTAQFPPGRSARLRRDPHSNL